MTMNVGRQIAELRRMTVTQLRQKHIEAFGDPIRKRHIRQITTALDWRKQRRLWKQLLNDTTEPMSRAEVRQA